MSSDDITQTNTGSIVPVPILLFIADLRLRGKSENTIRTYENALVNFHKWLLLNEGDINNLTRHDVQMYIQHLEIDKSASTIGKIFSAIRTFADYQDIPHIIKDIRVPQARSTLHISPDSLDRNERNKLLRDVERDGKLRDIAIVNLLLRTGVRVSELVALDRNHVEMSERKGNLAIRKGKGNVARKIPLSLEARLHLQNYLDTREDCDSALFLSSYKKRVSIRAVQRLLAKYGVHPHMLRHTFCRELVNAGVDISTVADLAGHTDINVTRRYSKPNEKELEDAIDKAFN